MARNWSVFINSVFFVLGFSFIFSLIGVLLQSVLLNVSYTVQTWLSYVGGTIIIFFGLYLTGLIKVPFLERDRRISVKRKFRYSYVTSFVFGAAFAVGWTPCVGAVLGAILTLAVTSPTDAFGLLLAYSLGLGVPFLIAGFFTQQLTGFIEKAGPKIRYLNIVFGVLLVIMGIFVFTNRLARLSSFELVTRILGSGGESSIAFSGEASLSILALGLSFVAGIVSFLSPCILPLVPGYLTYLGATASHETITSKKEEVADSKDEGAQ